MGVKERREREKSETRDKILDAARELFISAAMPANPVERIGAIGRTYVDFGTHYPNHYKLMFMTPHPPAELDDLDREIKGNPESDAYAFLKLSVEQAIGEGYFRDELRDAD